MKFITDKNGNRVLKVNNKIFGFANVRKNGQAFYAFGKPSAASFIAFDVDSIETAEARLLSYV